MSKEHVHKDLIIAWANGAKIQFYDEEEDSWYDCEKPWWDPLLKFRIKPEEKKKVPRWLWLHGDCYGNTLVNSELMTEEEAFAWGYIRKLEWSKTEFEE